MKKSLLTNALALVMAATVVLNPMNVKAATINEAEPNETKDTATVISVGDVYSGEIGSYNLYKERDYVDDEDYLKVKLEANKNYTIQMTNFFNFYEDKTLLVEMYAPNGQKDYVGFNFTHDSSNDVDLYSFTADQDGYYYIRLYNYVDYDTKQEHYYTISVVDDGVTIFRLYNSANGEHLYTTDANERDVLDSSVYPDWSYEGIAWIAPAKGTPVYRLYNPVLLNHLYTTDTNEVKVLTETTDWQVDNNGNPVFYSGGSKPIYRLYAEELNGMHHLTTDANEYNTLPSISGYVQEGVSFYAVK